MIHRNKEVCSGPGGSFQVTVELSPQFFPWGASAFCEEGSRILCTHTVYLEKFGLSSTRGDPESAMGIETHPLNPSPAVHKTSHVAVGKSLFLSGICKQGAGSWES